MENLINELLQPRSNAEGEAIGPSNLNRRAANALKQLLAVRLQNMLVIQTMQNELSQLREHYDKTHNSSNMSTSNDPGSDGGGTTSTTESNGT